LFRKRPLKAQNDYIFYKFGGRHGPFGPPLVYAYALVLPSEIFCVRHCLFVLSQDFTLILKTHKVYNSLQKYYLPRMKTSLGQLSLKYIGPKIWSNIPEKLKSSSPYSFGKKFLLSCQTSCWSSFYMLVTFCLIFVLYSCPFL